MSRPIKKQQQRGQSADQAARSLGTSHKSGQHALDIVEESIARDCEGDDEGFPRDAWRVQAGAEAS